MYQLSDNHHDHDYDHDHDDNHNHDHHDHDHDHDNVVVEGVVGKVVVGGGPQQPLIYSSLPKKKIMPGKKVRTSMAARWWWWWWWCWCW